MRLADLKRPHFFLPAGLVLVLAIGLTVVFHPAFQKKMLLEHVAPLVDSLNIGYVHVTPWSVELRNVSVGYRGGRFAIGDGTLRYCLSSLLLLNLNVKTLALRDVDIDLEKFTPPEGPKTPATGPFPGVLAALQHGLSYTLQELAIDAAVRLPDHRSLTASISGGGIKPKSRGTVTLALRFSTGRNDDHIQVDGRLALDQLTRGRFDAIEAVLAVQAALESLPETERVNLELSITPAPPGTDRQPSPPVTAPKDRGPQYMPEALHLALRLSDREGNSRSALDLQGDYDGNTGGVAGGYRLTANERLVKPYLKDAVIPPSGQVLTGVYDFNTAELTGNMTVRSDLAVNEIREVHPHEGLPEGLQLRNNFRVSLLPGRQLRIETLDTTVVDDANQERLASKLPADLQIPMNDIAGFLHQENTLLEFSLPALPLAWFNALLPDYDITDGTLKAAFKVTTDANAAVHLTPVKPLQVTGLTVKQQDKTLIEGLNLSVLPGAIYGSDALAVTLKKLVVDAGDGTLATADLAARLPLSGDGTADVTAQADADVDLHRLLEVLALKPEGRMSLPRHLQLDYQVALRQRADAMHVNKLDANLSLENSNRLLQLRLLHPLVLKNAPDGRKLANAPGDLATLTLSDIDLDWFSAFVPQTTLRGSLARADLTLSADAAGVATLTSARPVDLRHVTITTREGPLFDDLSIRVKPAVRLEPAGARIEYRDLGVTSHRTTLVRADGQVTVPAVAEQPLAADGHLELDLQALSRQPLIARALQAALDAPLRLEADYHLAQSDAAVDIDRLTAGLFYDTAEPRLSLKADSKLRVRTRLGGRQSELRRTTGKITLALSKLTPEPFASILKARGLSFSEANGEAVLVSDGRSLTVDTVAPVVIKGIALRKADSAVLNPFSVTLRSRANLRGETLQANLQELSLAFDRDRGTHAIDAHADLTLKGSGDDVVLDTLEAGISASLPPLLAQPAVLPGHTLTAGRLDLEVHKSADGKLAATTRIGDLKARKALALQALTLDLEGRLTPNGGFRFAAPLREKGKSGDSDIRVKAAFVPPPDGGSKVVDVDVDSAVFYLNDILNTLNAIAGKRKAAPPAGKKVAQTSTEEKPQPLELSPDTRAFWDTSDYDARVTFRLDRLFYTDYLEFRDVQGHVALLPDRFEIGDFSAHFHDSPIKLDSRLDFAPGEKPYNLKLRAGVTQFDLAKFFRELVPGSTPRAEGLFDVSLDAYGASPNMPQYRNNLFFDMRLTSRDGVFRPFDPDSVLLAGSSGFAGALGESVSNIPTGLFGLGAVSRLVNYMKEIRYDKMVIHLLRDESRDVQIREYAVQSPEILMTATGGIKYEEGVDIVDSPLSMEARLDMRERGAAILYSLGLLQSEKDEYGYWKGPEVKFWGTIGRTQSNLDEIIGEAGHGAVLGGITRPVSGLWGNLKYWWFGGGEGPAEYAQ